MASRLRKVKGMAVKFQDYYQTLGLQRNASADEIKRAYRKLAQKFHPDRNQDADASEKFSQIGEAYEVLKDPEKRKLYDQYGENYKAGQDFRPPPGYGGRGRARGGPGGFEFEGQDMSDFFREMFGRGAGGGGGGGGNPFGGAGGAGTPPPRPAIRKPRSPFRSTRPTTAAPVRSTSPTPPRPPAARKKST